MFGVTVHEPVSSKMSVTFALSRSWRPTVSRSASCVSADSM
jgi:hypothetical protein